MCIPLKPRASKGIMSERVEHDSRLGRATDATATAKAIIGSQNGCSTTFQSCISEQSKLPTCSKSQCPSCNVPVVDNGAACNSNRCNPLLSTPVCNGSGMRFDGNRFCLGVPHCLHYPLAQATAAPAILEGIQMKQAWCNPFYSKLPQLQFVTRLFHNNVLSKSIGSETLHGHRGVPCILNKDAQQQPAETRSCVLLEHGPWDALARIPVTMLPSSSHPCSSRFSELSASSLFPFQMPAHNAQGAANNTRFMSLPGNVEQARSSRGLELDKKPSMMQAIPFGREDLLGVMRSSSGAETGTRSGSCCLLCHPTSSQPVVGIPVQLQKQVQFPSSSSQWSQGSQEEGQGPSSRPMEQTSHCCSRWPNLRIGDAHGTFPFQACMQGEQSAAPPEACQQGNVASVGIRSQRNRVKGQWSLAEDKALVKLVKQYGTRRWSLISTFMASEFIANCFFWVLYSKVKVDLSKQAGHEMMKRKEMWTEVIEERSFVWMTDRSGKQCRERWVNHLQPDIRKEGWTKEEEELLVQAHSYFGNKWSAIAKMLPGRTDNSIKNHWHAALRKKDRHGKLRSNLLREYIQQKLAKNGNIPQQVTETTTNMLQERNLQVITSFPL